ncbi:hypothetical protein [Nereida sp. MMG025]|uniref:hypothetical protein n=1 Tax=Nereida sp. MMG025 TaxID=2909981 RepID=UPI001F322766|nr:hypothetical protein [Nereida sp. MMG025]MCF6445418.1 hypothetical protein [Nereida sp. MMG025]
MSNNESFIEEVTDELRSDQLWAAIRKYGWIVALAVIGIVGGASYNEFRKAQIENAAQAKGDAILDALNKEDPADVLTALDAAKDTGLATQFLLAGEQSTQGDTDAAIATYTAIAANVDAPAVYRDLATFKAVLLQGTDTPLAERKMAFEALAQPGGAYRLLAQEQLALIALESGDTDGAITMLQTLLEDTEVTQGLRRRATQAIVALGGTPLPTPTQQEPTAR